MKLILYGAAGGVTGSQDKPEAGGATILLTCVRDAEGSKKLNDLRGPFVVISPSGMCEAGRILHHPRHNIGDPGNTVLITGYQAENALGRNLVSGRT